jgi:Co/Zn/Cd efflux system component
LIGVETIRLTAVEQATVRVVAVAGLKVNIASVWLVTANLSHFLTDAGLTTNWIPTVTIEYSFGG